MSKMLTKNDQTPPTREMLEKESSELRVLLLHLDGMLVHQRDPYNLAEPTLYLCTWLERGTVRVQYLVQEQLELLHVGGQTFHCLVAAHSHKKFVLAPASVTAKQLLYLYNE